MFSFINSLFFYKVSLLMNHIRPMKKKEKRKFSYHANPIVSKSDLQIRTEL